MRTFILVALLVHFGATAESVQQAAKDDTLKDLLHREKRKRKLEHRFSAWGNPIMTYDPDRLLPRRAQAEAEGEGEGEGESEPEAEGEGEGEGEPELFFHDWEYGQGEGVGWALWGLHWAVLGALFLFGFFCAARALLDLKRKKQYGVNVQTLIRASIGLGCFWRALDLLVDPYNARQILPKTLQFLLFGQAFPCFMTGFALNMLRFVEVFSQIDLAKLGKLRELKQRAHKFLPKTRKLFYWTSGLEFFVQLVSDIIISQGTAQIQIAFAIVCQGYFLLWGFFLCAMFLRFACRLRTVMKAGGNIAGKTRAMFAITRLSCLICLVWLAIAAWWLVAIVGKKGGRGQISVATMFGLQTASRIVELLIVYLLIPSPLGTLCRHAGAKAGMVDPPGKRGGGSSYTAGAGGSSRTGSSSGGGGGSSAKVAVTTEPASASKGGEDATPAAAAAKTDEAGKQQPTSSRSSIVVDRYGGGSMMPRASVYNPDKTSYVGHGELDTAGNAGGAE